MVPGGINFVPFTRWCEVSTSSMRACVRPTNELINYSVLKDGDFDGVSALETGSGTGPHEEKHESWPYKSQSTEIRVGAKSCGHLKSYTF